MVDGRVLGMVIAGLLVLGVFAVVDRAETDQRSPEIVPAEKPGGTVNRFTRYDPDGPVNFTLTPGVRGLVNQTIWEPYNVTIAPDGYRDTIPEHGPATILVLGDSFTFGSGVGGNETWPARLDAQFLRASVINAAKPGGGFPDYLQMLENRDWPSVDMVIIGVAMNDYYSSGVAREMHAEVGEPDEDYVSEMARLQDQRFPEEERADRMIGFAREAREWGEERDIPVVFYLLQDSDRYTPPFRYGFFIVVEPPGRFTESRGAEDPGPYHLPPWYVHPNAEGHSLLAEQMAEFLQQRNLVRDRRPLGRGY